MYYYIVIEYCNRQPDFFNEIGIRNQFQVLIR